MTSAAAATTAMSNHCAIIMRSGASLPKIFSRGALFFIRPKTPFSSSYQRPNALTTKRYAHREGEVDEAILTSPPPHTTTYPYHFPCAVQVPPPPSWSIHELRLNSSDDDDNDTTISKEELAILARRCLIDIRYLSPERREELRRHVGGIMRCASVLLESKEFLDSRKKDGCYDDDDGENDVGMSTLTDEDVYDAPRGLTRMALRIEKNEDENTWSMYDSKESMAIMKSQSVRSKMIKSDDNDMFFAVVTKR